MKDSSGPAFPTDSEEKGGGSFYKTGHHEGLSKRELFAGLAMNGILSGLIELPEADWLRQKAYEYADSMLKQGEE